MLSLDEKYREGDRKRNPADTEGYQTERTLFGQTNKITPREILSNNMTNTLMSIKLEPFNGKIN